MNLLKNVFIPILLILSVHLSLQWKYFKDFPNHIHAWTQSDRYALALGFVDNNLDLFHPQTYYLNPTKDHPDLDRNTGITAVDFPLPDYIAAISMKITGSNSPVHFRIVVFLFFISGVYFLFLLIKSITNSYSKGLIYSLLISLSPVLVYYSNGFIPSVPAFSLSIIAFYFAYQFYSSNSKKHLALALIFFTIAAMIRATFILPLVSYIIWLLILNKPVYFLKKYIFILLIPSLFILYRLYNTHLASVYGSIFLGKFMPPSSFQDFKDILKLTLHNWTFHYFSIPQYLFLFIGLSYVMISNFKNKLFSFTLINTVFSLIFSLLLFKQFPAHDYYFIDLWMFPVLIWIIMSIKVIQQFKIEKNIIASLSFLLIVLAYLSASNKQIKRRDTGSWDQQEIQAHQFDASKPFIKELNLKKDDKILVLGSATTNIPLIKLDHKGYTIINTSKENIQKALNWDWNYVVIPNTNLFSDILKNDSGITSKIELYKSDEYLSFFTKKMEESNSFFPHEEITKYEYHPRPLIYGYGDSCQIKCIERNEFIGTFEIPVQEISSDLLLIEVHLQNQPENVELVLSSDGNSIYNRFSSKLETNFNDSYFQLVPLTDLKKNALEIKAYIYNPTKTFVEFDRFIIKQIKINE